MRTADRKIQQQQATKTCPRIERRVYSRASTQLLLFQPSLFEHEIKERWDCGWKWNGDKLINCKFASRRTPAVRNVGDSWYFHSQHSHSLPPRGPPVGPLRAALPTRISGAPCLTAFVSPGPARGGDADQHQPGTDRRSKNRTPPRQDRLTRLGFPPGSRDLLGSLWALRFYRPFSPMPMQPRQQRTVELRPCVDLGEDLWTEAGRAAP